MRGRFPETRLIKTRQELEAHSHIVVRLKCTHFVIEVAIRGRHLATNV